ncbi:MAG: DNA oxidative demethylase AlkB [Pseudomonadota bacterium]
MSSLPLDFGDPSSGSGIVRLGDEAVILQGFAADRAAPLLDAIKAVSAGSPFRHLVTRGGYKMSVAMTNCGSLGWVSDRSGYRYDPIDPETGRPWPAMPTLFRELAVSAATAAGFPDYAPDACLINEYRPGARLSLHQDRDERDRVAPIVSVSLGVAATFLWGGQLRTDRPRRIPVAHGDVAVWGGVDRMTFHGIAELAHGQHPLTGDRRYNLTFRVVR